MSHARPPLTRDVTEYVKVSLPISVIAEIREYASRADVPISKVIMWAWRQAKQRRGATV